MKERGQVDELLWIVYKEGVLPPQKEEHHPQLPQHPTSLLQSSFISSNSLLSLKLNKDIANMKFFSTLFFFSLLALVYSTAISTQESEYEAAKRDVTASDAKYVPATLPDGRKSISVYNGDVLEGSIVEGADGEVIVYDAFGKVLDMDDLDDDESSELQRRQSRFTILRKFFSFIRKYGARAWVSDAILSDLGGRQTNKIIEISLLRQLPGCPQVCR
jgi:hypothetical protein